MSEASGAGEPSVKRKDSVSRGAGSGADAPVTDPGQVRAGAAVGADGAVAGAAGGFAPQRMKAGALKKAARYRSRSLSASSADSYSSASYTAAMETCFWCSTKIHGLQAESTRDWLLCRHCGRVCHYRCAGKSWALYGPVDLDDCYRCRVPLGSVLGSGLLEKLVKKLWW